MLPIWTPSQRRVLLVLIGLLAIYLSIRHMLSPMYVGDPPPAEPARLNDLPSGIDLNASDESTLAALPIIGPSRARDIIEFRNDFAQSNPLRIPFQKPEDLMRVKGIGEATVDSLRPYLIFPITESSSSGREEEDGIAE
jgi:hypothetical protein